MNQSVLLLSGGLDSAAQLCLASEIGYSVEWAITIDYGQRARAEEIRAAKALCAHFQVKHKIIEFPFFQTLGVTAMGSLLNAENSLNLLSRENLDDHNQAMASAKKVWIPNRNGIFISLAAAFAESQGLAFILLGFNAEEAETFPDNSQAFLDASNAALKYSTSNQVQVASATTAMRKNQIVVELFQREFPMHLIWSCYDAAGPGQKPCGVCESCLRLERAKSFATQSLKDEKLTSLSSANPISKILSAGLRGFSKNLLTIVPLEKSVTYGGLELSPHWILQQTGVYGSSMAVFEGSCHVDTSHLVDFEDRLNADWIGARSMVHIIAEFFQPLISSQSLELAIYYQRLLIIQMEKALREMLKDKSEVTVSRRGDDLFVALRKGLVQKLSVSIATTSAVSVLIHWGINLDATGAPDHVNAAGLCSTLGFTPLDVLHFTKTSLEGYIEELEEIKLAQCKVQPRL